MNSAVMLEARGIRKVYNGSEKPLEVLKGINLNIDKGSFIAIVGPSGAGKSTLLHILGGLDEPTSGKILIDGQDMYGLRDDVLTAFRNKRIGFVFQFYHLLPDFTALENVAMPFLLGDQAGLGDSQIRDKCFDSLKRFGLQDRAGHFPSQLSGGEQQRIAMARALVNNPEVLLCDEPTGNLDTRAGDEVISTIKKLNAENKTTVIMVTHNMELAKMADKVLCLKDGALLN